MPFTLHDTKRLFEKSTVFKSRYLVNFQNDFQRVKAVVASSRLWRTTTSIGHQLRRRIVANLIVFLFCLLSLYAFLTRREILPALFNCSTWDTAVSPPIEIAGSVLAEFEQ